MKILEQVKRIYICMLAVYAILRDVIPLYYIVSSSIFSLFFFGFGLLLIAADLLSSKDCLRSYNCDFLLGFLIVCIISTVINYQYELISNFKAMGWMVLYYFLLYSNDAQKREKTLPALFRTFSITMTALIVISIPMYFFDVGYTYYKPEGTFTDQGFSFLYSRLWGVFHEANYAAVYTEIALFMSVYLAVHVRKILVTVLTVLQSLLFISFIVLSGSRTAVLVLLLAGIWMTFYAVFHRLSFKGLKRVLVSAGSGVLSVALLYAVLQGFSYGLPYVKTEIRQLTGKQFAYQAHLLYDNVYRMGQVNIAEGGADRLLGNDLTAPDTEAKDDVTTKPISRTDLEDADVSNGRFIRWKNGLEIFAASPIIGASPRGVSAFAKVHCPDTHVAKYSYSISNSVLDLMASTGIVGTLLMLIFLLSSAVHIVKNALNESFDLKKMILSGLIVLIVCSSILESDLFFLLTLSGVVFWLVLGLLNGNATQKMPLCYRLVSKLIKKDE